MDRKTHLQAKQKEFVNKNAKTKNIQKELQ